MSFAEPWLRYLESRKRELIYRIILSGDRPEYMPHTEILMKGDEVAQYFNHRKGMNIPNKISIEPMDVKKVGIETSDGFTFLIFKNREMKIKYADYSGEGLRKTKKDALIRKVEELGYNLKEFQITSV